MSKGTKMVALRIPPEIDKALSAVIQRTNKKRKAEEYTRTAWILKAITEKLAHLGRKPTKKLAVSENEVMPC